MSEETGAGGSTKRPNVEFCTLGMFILGMHAHSGHWKTSQSVAHLSSVLNFTDDIDFEGSQPNVKNVLGGAASYAVIGARMVAGNRYSHSVSWIVDVGSDFPPEVLDKLKAWDTDCVIRQDFGRLTTRAWNGYGPNEKRGLFSPPLRFVLTGRLVTRASLQIPDPEVTVRTVYALRFSGTLKNISHGLLLDPVCVDSTRHSTTPRGVGKCRRIHLSRSLQLQADLRVGAST